jgi:glycosyltransferase involved in cell wall biosynthesis
MSKSGHWKQHLKKQKGDMAVLGLVSFRVFPTHMGGQKGVALFYKHLRQHVPVVLAVSNDNKDSGALESYAVLHPNRKMLLNLFRLQWLKNLVRRRHISLVIAEHSYTGWLAWLLKRPFIIHSHNIESSRFRQMHKKGWRLYRAYEGWIHRRADHSFFISEEDRELAIQSFRVPPSRASVVTYGIEKKEALSGKAALRRKLGLDENLRIFLFNGTLDYKPNYDAVVRLVEEIDPLLRKKMSGYRIIITGNRAPAELIKKMLGKETIHFEGYVEDVDLYYQASDLFLNPVSNDTGVKTKLIEAIANNCTAVSTWSGASGIRKDLCGQKLVCVTDGEWNSFVDLVMQAMNADLTTGAAFYDYYLWENIAARAADKINELMQREQHT